MEAGSTGSAWNRGGNTWEEKPINTWAKELLKEDLLPALAYDLSQTGVSMPALPPSESAGGESVSVSVRVQAVDKVDGEVTYVVSRGKQRVVFELTLKLALEIEVRRRSACHFGGVPPSWVLASRRRRGVSLRHAHHRHSRLHAGSATRALSLCVCVFLCVSMRVFCCTRAQVRVGSELKQILTGKMTVNEVSNDDLDDAKMPSTTKCTCDQREWLKFFEQSAKGSWGGIKEVLGALVTQAKQKWA